MSLAAGSAWLVDTTLRRKNQLLSPTLPACIPRVHCSVYVEHRALEVEDAVETVEAVEADMVPKRKGSRACCCFHRRSLIGPRLERFSNKNPKRTFCFFFLFSNVSCSLFLYLFYLVSSKEKRKKTVDILTRSSQIDIPLLSIHDPFFRLSFHVLLDQ
jgi:hypothetical protein